MWSSCLLHSYSTLVGLDGGSLNTQVKKLRTANPWVNAQSISSCLSHRVTSQTSCYLRIKNQLGSYSSLWSTSGWAFTSSHSFSSQCSMFNTRFKWMIRRSHLKRRSWNTWRLLSCSFWRWRKVSWIWWNVNHWFRVLLDEKLWGSCKWSKSLEIWIEMRRGGWVMRISCDFMMWSSLLSLKLSFCNENESQNQC